MANNCELNVSSTLAQRKLANGLSFRFMISESAVWHDLPLTTQGFATSTIVVADRFPSSYCGSLGTCVKISYNTAILVEVQMVSKVFHFSKTRRSCISSCQVSLLSLNSLLTFNTPLIHVDMSTGIWLKFRETVFSRQDTKTKFLLHTHTKEKKVFWIFGAEVEVGIASRVSIFGGFFGPIVIFGNSLSNYSRNDICDRLAWAQRPFLARNTAP